MSMGAEGIGLLEEPDKHAANFANKYAEFITRPLELQNHTCSLIFESRERLVRSREKEIKGYLTAPITGKRVWGRTLAAEIAISMIMRPVLVGAFRHLDGRIFLVPTDLDRSEYKGPDYHKGCDLLLAAGGKPLSPLLGIDVTIGHGKFLRKKMERVGVHLGLGIPVTVLPLRGLPFGDEHIGIHEYLDMSFREQIKTSGRYNPFAGWRKDAQKTTETALLERLIDQLELTKSGLWQTGDLRITNYAHLSGVFAQIMRLQNSCGRHLIELNGRRSFLMN